MAFTFTIQDFNQFGPVVPLPQEGIYENDFTTNLVGNFDPNNSDYINSRLTLDSIINGTYELATITSLGLQSATNSKIEFYIIENTDQVNLISSVNLVAEGAGCSFSLRASDDYSENMGVTVTSNSAGVYITSMSPSSTINQTLIDAASSTWIGTSLEFDIHILVNNSISIRVNNGTEDIFNMTTFLTEVDGTKLTISINNLISVENAYIEGPLAPYLSTPEKQTPDGGYTSDIDAISNGTEGIIFAGYNEEIQSSVDAEIWNSRFSGISAANFTSALFGDGLYIVGGAFKIYTSSNIIDWVEQTISLNISSGVYGGTYILGGNNGQVLKSTTGASGSWTTQKLSGSFANTFTGTSFGDNTYIVVGRSTTFRSQNQGSSWSQIEIGGDWGISINFGDGVFIVVGYSGSIRRSEDNGLTWSSVANANGFTGTFNAVVFGEGFWVIAGLNGEIQYSNDGGLTWTHVDSYNGYIGTFNSVAFRDDKFTLVGDSGEIQNITIIE